MLGSLTSKFSSIPILSSIESAILIIFYSITFMIYSLSSSFTSCSDFSQGYCLEPHSWHAFGPPLRILWFDRLEFAKLSIDVFWMSDIFGLFDFRLSGDLPLLPPSLLVWLGLLSLRISLARLLNLTVLPFCYDYRDEGCWDFFLDEMSLRMALLGWGGESTSILSDFNKLLCGSG